VTSAQGHVRLAIIAIQTESHPQSSLAQTTPTENIRVACRLINARHVLPAFSANKERLKQFHVRQVITAQLGTILQKKPRSMESSFASFWARMFLFIPRQVHSSVQFTLSETSLAAEALTIAVSAILDISAIKKASLIKKIFRANRDIIALVKVCLLENVQQEECRLKIIWLLALTIAWRVLLDVTVQSRLENSSTLTELNVLWDTSVPVERELR